MSRIASFANFLAMEKPMMSAADVLDLYNGLERTGIAIWLDGGWGVDANLGIQTRPHGDLDIFIQQKDVTELRGYLGGQGYREIKLEIARPHNFVLGSDTGREVDVHVVVFEGENAVYGSAGNGEVFPASVFGAIGTIEGQEVRCITPVYQVNWHSGYTPRESDFKDVAALCERFGLDYPAGYGRLKRA